MSPCPACGRTNPAGRARCAECGKALLRPPSPLGTGALLPSPPSSPEALAFPDGPSFQLQDAEALATALQSATPGTTLRLPAGRFELPARAILRRALRIQGAGAGATTLVGGGAAWALRVDELAYLMLEDLTLLHEGASPSDLLVVAGGHASLKQVVVSGGAAVVDWTQAPYAPGGRGVVAWGEAHLRLEGCELARHASDGLVLLDHAQALAQGCVAVQNRGSGFLATAHSRLALEACELVVNFRDGLAANEHARVQAKASLAGRNGGEGFAAYGGSELSLEGCQAAENRKSGLAAYQHAKVWAQGGKARRNQEHGLHADDSAQVLAEGLWAEQNGLSGFAFLGRPGGALRSVRTTGNKALGLQLGPEADPRLEGVDAQDNLLGAVRRVPAPDGRHAR